MDKNILEDSKILEIVRNEWYNIKEEDLKRAIKREYNLSHVKRTGHRQTRKKTLVKKIKELIGSCINKYENGSFIYDYKGIERLQNKFSTIMQKYRWGLSRTTIWRVKLEIDEYIKMISEEYTEERRRINKVIEWKKRNRYY